MKTTSTSAKSARPEVELLPPSITVRVGRRRLTLAWRPRKALPRLLSSLLRRSWRRVLAPALRLSVSAAAVAAAWHAPVWAAAPLLPTNGVATYGNLTFTLDGNTLQIRQTSGRAIATFDTFSIGLGNTVDVRQPNAAAALLAKVTGSQVSEIYGTLKADGTVILLNPNGILVGSTGVVDVGRFVATTLNISDSDFIADKLTFSKGDAVAGSVGNYGNITSAAGGSVYLIGANVINGGIIRSPQGEVILAAGQSVTLADTATPGVTVNVTGSAGNVTNLGAITAEAGRIGIAAGLVNNSGNISASSVVREGGRIFLRASNNLTTTANSSITADGAVGGNITLFADNKAYIDGDVSATGAPGKGGFVETSGLGSLDVVKAPTVGSGGTWYIDPFDLEVVTAGAAGTELSGCMSNAITSVGSSARILNTTINALLNGGTGVTLSTGAANGSSQAGNITVSADISKTSGSSASLTLNADQDIKINANITSTSSALGLNLNTNYRGLGSTGAATVGNGARVMLNGGVLNASDGAGGNGNGVLDIAGGSVNVGMQGTLNAGGVSVGAGSSLVFESNSSMHANTLDNAGMVSASGNLFTLTLNDRMTNNGTVNFNSSTTTLAMENGLSNNGTVNFNGAGSLFSNGSVVNEQTGVMNFTTGGVTFNTSGKGAWVNNGMLAVAGADEVLSMSNDSGLQNNGNLTVGAGAAVLGTGAVSLTNNGIITLGGGSMSFWTLTNAETGSISGNGAIATVSDEGDGFTNNGILTPGGTGAIGSLTINGGGFVQNDSGEMRIDVASAGSTDQIIFNTSYVHLGGTLRTGLTNGYQPALGDTFRPFTLVGGINSLGNSYFHTVTGDVRTVNGAKQMLKATYGDDGDGMKLTMMGASTFYARGSGDWVDRESWSASATNPDIGVGYLPTQIDNVVINNVTASHGQGTDTVDSLTISGAGRLNVGGGDLNVLTGSSFTDSAQLSLNGANVSLGATSIGSGARLFVNSGNMNMTNAAVNGEIDLSSGTLTLAGTTTGSGYISMTSGGGEEGGFFNGFNVVEGGDAPTKTLNMANALSDLKLQIMDGDFNFNGSVRVANMSVYSGNVTGTVGSKLNVAEDFYQGGGNITVDSAAFSSGQDWLTFGNITANNLVLEARNGQIVQSGGTSLHVRKQLIASAVTGIDLGTPGFGYGEGESPNNYIAALAANNSGTGDITVINHLNADDASVVTINGVRTASGNINIENYGGARTAAIGSNADFLGALPMSASGSEPSAAAKLAVLGINSADNGKMAAPNGNISLVTHSPLTIGIGGVTASGGITLTAGSSSGNDDNLVINGIIQSLGGNINLTAGDGMTVNANISTSPPGFAIVSVLSGQVVAYAQGVTITDSNGTVTPVPLPPPANDAPVAAPVTASAATTDKVQGPTNQGVNAVVQAASSLLSNQARTVAGPQVTTSSASQTAGGTSGSFGDEGGQGKQDGKKPLPMCT